jgi:hypothetical protein
MKNLKSFEAFNYSDTYEVIVKGIDLMVNGEYVGGDRGDYHTPGVKPNFEIESISMLDEDGQEVLISDEKLKLLGISYEDVENAVINQMED